MTADEQQLLSGLDHFFSARNCHITILTGAGISAASGIPTFRGPEGYWTVGSAVYMPQQMATHAMFQQQPEEVWKWYLYRLGLCLHAEPNAGHHALVRMEHLLGDRFSLITQNIDNLHIRAGSSPERTFQIHGNINLTRCSRPCNTELLLLPGTLRRKRAGPNLSAREILQLHCPHCDSWLRPHVLWFDEYYDEEYFRFESAMAVAAKTDLLIITGTSGATTLPNHIAAVVYQRQKTIIDINIDENIFTPLARESAGGMFIKAPAAEILPLLAGRCRVVAGH
jgi:NAD-dependent deacetylase